MKVKAHSYIEFLIQILNQPDRLPAETAEAVSCPFHLPADDGLQKAA